jgi:hypothetical protein
MVAGFLAVVVIAAHLLRCQSLLWKPLGVCAVIGAYNGILFVTQWLDRKPRLVTVVWLHFDLLALTWYLHYCGDIENPLMYAYSLPVAAGAILVSRRAGFLLSASGAILLFLLMYATCYDSSPVNLSHNHLALLNGVDLTQRADPDMYGGPYIITNILILAAILSGLAYGCGTLTQRLRNEPVKI